MKATQTNIKESNYWAIHDFALLGDNTRIQGTKLNALYNLIQNKGEAMKTKNSKLNGVKCLHIKDGFFVAMIHTPYKKGSFFPCMLKTYHLQEL